MDFLPHFQYQPLKHFDTRILLVFPSPADAPLQIGIELWNLKDAEERRHHTRQRDLPCALSYAWGDMFDEVEVGLRLKFDPDTRCMQCGCALTTIDHQCVYLKDSYDLYAKMETRFPIRRKFCIPRTLENALRNLRFPSRALLIWADAICIDQKNLSEKGHLVQNMDLVYKNAHHTHAWLGESADDSDLAIDLSEELENSIRVDEDSGETVLDTNAFLQKTKALTWKKHWDGLAKLISRPWFRRRWIIHEVVFSRQTVVHCGDRKFSLGKLFRVTEFLLERRAGGKFEEFGPISADVHRTIHTTDYLHELMHQQQQLSMTHEGTSAILPVEMLCFAFFRSLCTDSRDIVYSLLPLAHDADRRSLFPDYSASITVVDVFIQAFEAIVDRTKSLDIIHEAYHFPLDTVESWLPCFGGYARNCFCGRNHTDEKLEHIYNRMSKSGERQASLSVLPSFKVENTRPRRTIIVEGYAFAPILHGPPDDMAKNDDRVGSLEASMINVNFLSQEEETAENGPAQRGDIVCILFGCCMPTVLRPCQSDYCEYQLVCACSSTEAVMRGEFMERCQKENIPPQKFRIV